LQLQGFTSSSSEVDLAAGSGRSAESDDGAGEEGTCTSSSSTEITARGCCNANPSSAEAESGAIQAAREKIKSMNVPPTRVIRSQRYFLRLNCMMQYPSN
jgi:hypothetical protein